MKKRGFHLLHWMKEFSLLLNPFQWSSHRYINLFRICLNSLGNISSSGCSVYGTDWNLLLWVSDNCAAQKFFDGMDDDGSEFNLQSLMIILNSFHYSVLKLNSPLLKFMIMNGECCFRSSRQWGIHQEP